MSKGRPGLVLKKQIQTKPTNNQQLEQQPSVVPCGGQMANPLKLKASSKSTACKTPISWHFILLQTEWLSVCYIPTESVPREQKTQKIL